MIAGLVTVSSPCVILLVNQPARCPVIAGRWFGDIVIFIHVWYYMKINWQGAQWLQGDGLVTVSFPCVILHDDQPARCLVIVGRWFSNSVITMCDITWRSTGKVPGDCREIVWWQCHSHVWYYMKINQQGAWWLLGDGLVTASFPCVILHVDQPAMCLVIFGR